MQDLLNVLRIHKRLPNTYLLTSKVQKFPTFIRRIRGLRSWASINTYFLIFQNFGKNFTEKREIFEKCKIFIKNCNFQGFLRKFLKPSGSRAPQTHYVATPYEPTLAGPRSLKKIPGLLLVHSHSKVIKTFLDLRTQKSTSEQVDPRGACKLYRIALAVIYREHAKPQTPNFGQKINLTPKPRKN